MGFTKDQLLARLKELQIDFVQYEHPAVMTAAEQEKYVGDKGGQVSVNLFLKDKKSRFYIVSSLVDTKVDLKVLSQRLGLGKGGIRMAPEEALGEILQVPLGSVTPLALVNESARNVSLLLDKRFQALEHCFFHPLSNDMSIALKACDLDKFLKSIGREALYVDLEANPVVGKDQPPDLAAFVPSESIALPDGPGKATLAPLKGPAESNISVDKKVTSVKASKSHATAQNQKEKPTDGAHEPSVFSDAGLLAEQIVEKTTALVLSEITEDTIKQHGEHLGTVVADKMRKRLSADFSSILMLFKNTAYTEGFHAGAHRH